MGGTCLACGSPPRPCHASFVCVWLDPAGAASCWSALAARHLWPDQSQSQSRSQRARKINQQSQGLHCSNQAIRSLQRQMQGLLCHPRKRQCAADLMIFRAAAAANLMHVPSMQRHANTHRQTEQQRLVLDLDEMALSDKRERDNRTRSLARSGNGSATPLPPKSWESRGGPSLAGQTIKKRSGWTRKKKRKIGKKVKLTQSQTVTDDTEQAMQRH